MTAKLPRVFSARALPWVLFVISLALNAFFIGGHVYGRYYAQQISGTQDGTLYKERPAMVARRLGLEPEQRRAFRQLRRHMRQTGKELMDKSRSDFEAFWLELAAENPDDKRIENLLRNLTENRLLFQLEAIRSAREFMTTLSPEQKTRFIEMTKKRFKFGGPSGAPERPRLRQPREGYVTPPKNGPMRLPDPKDTNDQE